MNNIYLYLVLGGFVVFSFISSDIFNFYDFLPLYRVLILFISLFLLIINGLKNSVYLLPIYFFLFMYFCGLINDLYINPINLYYDGDDENVRNANFYFFQFLGLSLIPFFGGLSANINKINFQKIFYWTYFSILFCLTFSTIYTFYNPIFENIRSTGLLKMSVLILGQIGSILMIFSMINILNSNKKSFIFLNFFSLSIGLINIFMSGSRSGLISITLLFIILFLKQFNLYKGILYLCFISLFIMIFGLTLIDLINNYFPNRLFDRIIYSIEFYYLVDTSRVMYLQSALQEFYQNPFLGKSFLLSSYGVYGSYPHNLIVESFQSTGIFGGLCFTYTTLLCLYHSLFSQNLYKNWLKILYLQFFIFGLFSGNLFSNFFFYSFLGLNLNLIINRLYDET